MSLAIFGNIAAMKTRTVREILAENLRRVMDSHPILNTQGRLATRSGIAQRTVGRMQKGEVDPQLGHVEAVANALGITVIDLLTDTHARKNKTLDLHGLDSLDADEINKIQSFIDFIVASRGVASRTGDAARNVSETIEPPAEQKEAVQRVAQRRKTNRALSIDEQKTPKREYKRH